MNHAVQKLIDNLDRFEGKTVKEVLNGIFQKNEEDIFNIWWGLDSISTLTHHALTKEHIFHIKQELTNLHLQGERN